MTSNWLSYELSFIFARVNFPHIVISVVSTFVVVVVVFVIQWWLLVLSCF